MSLEDLDVLFVASASSHSSLEMAGNARTGVEDRAKAVSLGKWVSRRPLVVEELQAGSPRLGAGLGGPRHGNARSKAPADPYCRNSCQGPADSPTSLRQ